MMDSKEVKDSLCMKPFDKLGVGAAYTYITHIAHLKPTRTVG
jgi:hypothetical protein